MRELSRRNFFTGMAATGALAAASLAVGCSPAKNSSDSSTATATEESNSLIPNNYYIHEDLKDLAFPDAGEIAFVADEIKDSDITEEVGCDFLVIGAGPAGLCAAASAADNGLNVVLLEKSSVISAHATCLGNYNSKVMQEANFPVEEQTVLDCARVASQFRCDEDVWKMYFRRSGEAADWLLDTVMDESHKMVFPVTGDATVGGFRWLDSWFMWPGGQSGFQDAFERVRDFCIEKGVDLRFNTAGAQLITDGNGEIIGAYAKSKDGKFIKITASRGTLLATGSYEYNKEMMEKCVRPRDRMAFAWCNPCTGDTGDGHMMGLALGAAMDDYPHSVMMDNTGAKDGSFYSLALFGTTRFNDSGKRFCNNYLPNNFMANAIQNQHGAHAFNICDSQINEKAAVLMGGAPFDLQVVIDKFVDNSVKCSTVKEVADVIGCDEATIQASLDEWNAACDAGVDEQYQTAPNFLLKIDTPPYYVMEESGALLATTGGLRVNEKSEVLDREGKPLKGLYAAGNVSGSMFYDTYPHQISAVSTGRCLTFGYLLGRRLAGLEG